MRTPNPSPHGLPTRCKAFDNPPALRESVHWSYDPTRKLRGKVFRVSARLTKLRALLSF
jgi:hypothetical protein